MKNAAALILSALVLSSCTSKPPVNKAPGKETVSIESKQLASEEESNLVTEISFPKGRAGIPETAKADIKRIYQQAAKKGEINQVKIITWADKEYPSVHTKRLHKEERRLVRRRNDAIKNYLESLDKNIDVDRYSMAERPNALKTMFSTEDARIKRSLETAGIPNTDTTVKVPGKASKSIVIFVMED